MIPSYPLSPSFAIVVPKDTPSREVDTLCHYWKEDNSSRYGGVYASQRLAPRFLALQPWSVGSVEPAHRPI